MSLRPTGRPYRAQVNLPDPDSEHPPALNVDISRSTSSDRHSGHSTPRSASCIRRSISNVFEHFWHRYSYKGMVRSTTRMQQGPLG